MSTSKTQGSAPQPPKHQVSSGRRKANPRVDRAQQTRQHIFDAALDRFAEQGPHGASLRDISNLSEVPLSSLHYHFGSKEQLFSAAVEHVFNELSKVRLERLRALGAPKGGPALEDVLRAFIEPTLDLACSPSGLTYLRLQARAYTDMPSEHLTTLILEATAPFRDALRRALPELSHHELMRGYRILVRDISSAAIDPFFEVLTGSPAIPHASAVKDFTDTLVRYHAAGMRSLSRQ